MSRFHCSLLGQLAGACSRDLMMARRAPRPLTSRARCRRAAFTRAAARLLPDGERDGVLGYAPLSQCLIQQQDLA